MALRLSAGSTTAHAQPIRFVRAKRWLALAAMESKDIPPHLSAEEHSLLAIEEQLIKDGSQWLKRAATLYTQTPKIKIWVPVLCSVLLTCYYLYLIHSRTAAAPADAVPVAQVTPVAVPVAVAEDSPQALAKSGQAATGSTAVSSAAALPEIADVDGSDAELLKRAQQAHSSQQFGEEAGLLEKILDRSQSTTQVCPAVGKAYERAGAIDAAIKAFERCVAHDPGNVDVLVAFAHALQEKPDFKRALALYHQSLQRDPANLDAQMGLALVELKENHLQGADEAARLVLQKMPDSTDALLITGIVAWRKAKLAEAEKIFLKGVALDDHRADFHGFLGRVEEAQRRPQDALQQYEKALLLDPNDSEIAERRDRLRDAR